MPLSGTDSGAEVVNIEAFGGRQLENLYCRCVHCKDDAHPLLMGQIDEGMLKIRRRFEGVKHEVVVDLSQWEST